MSLSSLESTGGPSGCTHLGKCISVSSAKSGSGTGTAPGGADLLLWCSCLRTIPCCPCPHFALFPTIERVFLQFPFGDSCCEAKEAHSPWPHNCSCSIQHLLIFSLLPPLRLRVLSHLPCHDSSVNHLEPSFARQGSMELMVHHNVSWLFQHPEKKSPDGCAYGAVINSGVIAKPHWILIASCYKRKQMTGL